MSLVTLDRAGFTPSGRWNTCFIPELYSLTRSIKAVNVSSVSKLSKYVSPLLDVHAEHLRARERDGKNEPTRPGTQGMGPPAAPAPQ